MTIFHEATKNTKDTKNLMGRDFGFVTFVAFATS
jgi:hypothetical protein